MYKHLLFYITLFCLYLLNGCGLGASIPANQLSSNSLANSYLNFTLIDNAADTWPSIQTEEAQATLCLNSYCIYNIAVFGTIAITLGNNENFSVAVNNQPANIMNLLPPTLFINGIYSYTSTPTTITLPNSNPYTIFLTYRNNTYSGSLTPFYTYALDSATCDQLNATSMFCTITTNNNQSLASGVSATYTLQFNGSNCTVNATATPTINNGSDTATFSFSGPCAYTNTPSLSLTLSGPLVALSNQQQSNESQTLGGMQGQYVYKSKVITPQIQ